MEPRGKGVCPLNPCSARGHGHSWWGHGAGHAPGRGYRGAGTRQHLTADLLQHSPSHTEQELPTAPQISLSSPPRCCPHATVTVHVHVIVTVPALYSLPSLLTAQQKQLILSQPQTNLSRLLERFRKDFKALLLTYEALNNIGLCISFKCTVFYTPNWVLGAEPGDGWGCPCCHSAMGALTPQHLCSRVLSQS